MDLEYYLFCKNRYKSINRKIQNMIDDYDTVISEKYLNNDNFNIHFLIKEKYTLIHIQNILINSINDFQNKINESCNHVFENDMIDISSDRSENIKYCILCGLRK